jgi:flagellar protein FliJ
MSRYKFRLQSVLDLQTMQRDQKRGELAEAFGILHALELRRAELNAQQQELQGLYRTPHGECQMDVQRVVELQRYEQVLRGLLEELSVQDAYWAQETQCRQANLEQADREVKVLEKIDQRQRQERRQRQRNRVVQELDEIGLTSMHFQ